MGGGRLGIWMRAVSALYYVSFILLGNYILLNLFLAVLIDSFLKEGDKESNSQKVEDNKMHELEETLNKKDDDSNLKRLRSKKKSLEPKKSEVSATSQQVQNIQKSFIRR